MCTVVEAPCWSKHVIRLKPLPWRFCSYTWTFTLNMIEKAAISMAPPQPSCIIAHVYVFTCPCPDHWIQSLARVYVCACPLCVWVCARARLCALTCPCPDHRIQSLTRVVYVCVVVVWGEWRSRRKVSVVVVVWSGGDGGVKGEANRWTRWPKPRGARYVV